MPAPEEISGKPSSEFFFGYAERAAEWFSACNNEISEAATKTRDFLCENIRSFGWDGEPDGGPVFPPHDPHVSNYIDAENIANLRLRGLANGICEILIHLANLDKVNIPARQHLHFLLSCDSLQLMRDLEFVRIRNKDDLPPFFDIKDLQKRYFPSVDGGNQRAKFREKLGPLIQTGLVALRGPDYRDHQVLSGPVLIALTDKALMPVFEERKLHPNRAPDNQT